MSRLARHVKQLLQKRGEKTIALGQFSGAGTFPSSGGPGIARVLAEELRNTGIRIRSRAAITIEGKYEAVKAEETGKVLAQLIVNVRDRRGTQLLSDNRRTILIFGVSEIAALLGLTVHLNPEGSRQQHDRELERKLEVPQFNGRGSQVAADPKTSYSIEILVGSSPRGKFVPRQPTNEEGLAYVPIQRKEYYRIRVLNKSAYDAAVTVTIDGINMFAFSKVKHNRKRYVRFLLGAGKDTVIKGWHITNKKSKAFEVTSYARSAAAELKSKAPVGTITATFAAAWAKNSRAPTDEKNALHKGPDQATGRGPRIDSRYKEVERKVGRIRDAISIRYTRRGEVPRLSGGPLPRPTRERD
jgi:hypothetical protein